MKERIEVQKLFTIADCEANPHKYYIFGDNLMRQGTGGQAIIRYCRNAIGIPTKRLPSMEEDAFFSDKIDEYSIVSKRLARLVILYEDTRNYILVFPEDGLGTGRAQLKERSPEIYNLIDGLLKQYFELEIMP